MRLVYLHQYFKTPDMAGGTRSYEMARRFVRAGHQVHVITTRPGGRRGWSVEDVDGVTVHWLGLAYDNKMSALRRLAAFAVFAVRASLRARRVAGDVVLATSTPLTIAVPGLVATTGTEAPMVFEVRDLWPEVPIALGALRSKNLQRAARGLERLAYRRSHCVVALSEGMADGVRATCRSRHVEVIPNSCDNDLFDIGSEHGRAFRDSRPWLGPRPLVLYAGTLGRVNGVGYMVDLAVAYRELDPEARFLVIGEGAERDAIEEKARDRGVWDDNFFMEPPVPKHQMPVALSAADICTSWVIPVRELEANSANKVFDALAAGRPLAINHGGWQADMIQHHEVGVVLPPTSSTAAAHRLREFLDDSSRVRRARSAARSLARTDFDRDVLAARFLQLLEAAAAGAPVPPAAAARLGPGPGPGPAPGGP